MTPEEDIFPEDTPKTELTMAQATAKTPPVAVKVEPPKTEAKPPEPEKNGILSEKDAEMVLEKLLAKGFIIKVSIGYCGFTKKLTHKDLGVSQKDAPEDVVALGKKRLVRKSSLEKIKSIESKARSLTEGHSTETWIPGLRFITEDAAKKIYDELLEYRKEFFKESEIFVKDYPDMKAQMLKDFPDWAAKLEPFYPSVERVKKMFRFDISGLDDDCRITLVRKEAKILGEAKLAIKSNLMGKLNTFLKDTVMSTRQQFIEELTAMASKLNEGGKIHGKTVKKVHEMIEVAKAKDFANDTEFLAQLDKFKKEFDKDALNDKQYKKQVLQTIDTIVHTAKDEKKAKECVEEFKRSIVV